MCIQPSEGDNIQIYLKRKYCTIVTSQPSREDREIEEEKVALLLNIWFCFFNISFLLFSLYKHVKSSVLLQWTYTHENHQCVFLSFFFLFVCVCCHRHPYRYTHTHKCTSMLSLIHKQSHARTFKHTHTHSGTLAHMLTGWVWVNRKRCCTSCVPVLRWKW